MANGTTGCCQGHQPQCRSSLPAWSVKQLFTLGHAPLQPCSPACTYSWRGWRVLQVCTSSQHRLRGKGQQRCSFRAQVGPSKLSRSDLLRKGLQGPRTRQASSAAAATARRSAPIADWAGPATSSVATGSCVHRGQAPWRSLREGPFFCCWPGCAARDPRAGRSVDKPALRWHLASQDSPHRAPSSDPPGPSLSPFIQGCNETVQSDAPALLVQIG